MDNQKGISAGETVKKAVTRIIDNDLVINTYKDNFIPQFAIVMPVHNEENAIAEVVNDVYDKLTKNTTCSFEIVLSEDGSKDNTRDVIINLSRKIPLKASLSYNKKGYAGGIKEGLGLVTAPFVLISDSDGQLKPEDFWVLKEQLDSISNPKEVIISGSRKIRADDLHRKIISKTFQKLNSITFDLDSIRDSTSPFKLMSTELAKKLASECRFMNESFWMEFVIRACDKNIKIVEVEIQHTKRLKDETVVYKKSKIPKIVINQLIGLVKLKTELTGKPFVTSILQTKSVRRLITFALVGASGAAIILFSTWLGVNFGIHYVISAAIGIETSIVWAFLLNDRITFKDKIDNYKLSNAFFRFLKYNASSLGGETINLATLFILTTGGLFYLYSEVIAILVAFTFNYTLSRKWVWAKK